MNAYVDAMRRYFDFKGRTGRNDFWMFTLVFVVIATDDKDANSQIADLVDGYGERVRWLVARNQKDGMHLPLFGQSNSRRRLLELGFVEGARIELLHEGLVGGDPIAMKVDDMRVALRRHEAAGLVVRIDTVLTTIAEPAADQVAA